MINVEKFAERLNIIMNYYEISAALFAEKIDVQRSSISHILSGRNKPSLDFVLKILKEFPDVELYWLLNGTGNFPKSEVNKANPTPSLFAEENLELKKTTEVLNEQVIPVDIQNNEIDRIVIFFKDGAFKNYKQQ